MPTPPIALNALEEKFKAAASTGDPRTTLEAAPVWIDFS
jgi:hypothetical protein